MVKQNNDSHVNDGQLDLVNQMASYVTDFDDTSVLNAVAYAKEMHEGQTRASGEPYYTHPVEVACILADLKMDQGTIITAILHDTLEDTPATFEDLEERFGKEIATLVSGVSKLTKIESKTHQGKQGENFSKLLLAISEDIRVLIVKLGDRLHNMRTLHHFSSRPDKQRRIAIETLEIFVPLAERIGIQKIKEELEDIAFSILNPEARESISNRLAYLRKEGTDTVNSIIDDLKSLVEGADIPAYVTGREKTRYSIWKKMQRKNVSFEQLSDIMAFRVVVDDVAHCYVILGLLHSKFSTVPGRFKDYISTPKSNGYRSIHTTVIIPGNQRIEIQIRTEEMHEEAILGVAAHWSYKANGSAERVSTKDVKKYRWLRELLDILEQEQRPEDFMENTKLELFQEQVYVFTPKGDLIELPNGATTVDFAYAIHSAVGNRTVGGKVNGRISPLNTKLNNGDQVEIITSKTGNPSPTWERFVATGKARSHIRKYIRQQQRSEYAILGKAMLQKVFRKEDYDFSEKAIAGVLKDLKEFNAEDVEDVYVAIGSGNTNARDVFRMIFPSHQAAPATPSTVEEVREMVEKKPKPVGADKPMPIKGLVPGMAVHFARCCHPLPGDRIVGIVTTGKGVTIHTIDCETLETFADTPERWIDVSWGDGPDAPESHVGRLEITLSNKSGALGTLSTVIAKNGGNITNLKITSRSLDFWEMLVDVYVSDIDHLKNIIAALRAMSQISSVDRAKGR